ncbi:hypothetical protein D3C80_1990390 [compost metagenome]
MRTRDNMIECQIVMRAAILALEPVAQEDIKAGKGRVSGRLHIGFEAYDTR